MSTLSIAEVTSWESTSVQARDLALEEQGVVDGLPLALVEPRAVETALACAKLTAGDVVATMPPLSKPASAESLAICALLAGCAPEHVPVVFAAVKAISDPAFNGLGVLTTTGTAAIATIVSGPVARQFNSGSNLLGPGNRANAAVGRAVALSARAVGGSLPGLTDMATMGQPGKYTFCFAESGEANPWGPHHVAAGLGAEQSVVTVFAASGTVEVTNMHAASADDVIDTLAESLYLPGTISFDDRLTGGGRYVVVVSPDWMALLSGEGLSRRDLCEQLASRAAWPVSRLPTGLRRPMTAEPGQLGVMQNPQLRAVASPSDIVVVVGGGVGTKQTVIPCWAGGSKPVFVAVEGPAEPEPIRGAG